MSVDLHFNFNKAVKAGVKFTPNIEERYLCNDNCGCFHGEDCTSPAELTTYQSGWLVECPDGSKGFAILSNLFQCKGINQEIRSWFLTNVKGSRLSY
jgi:hypothetical protein